MKSIAAINATPEQQDMRDKTRILRIHQHLQKPTLSDTRRAELQAELDRRLQRLTERAAMAAKIIEEITDA